MIFKRFYSLLKSGFMWAYAYKCCEKAVIMSPAETVEAICREQRSLIRYGDGEFFLMAGYAIHYQEYDDSLASILRGIVSESECNHSTFLLCMPKFYFECSGRKIIGSTMRFRSWVRPRYMFKRDYDRKGMVFGDAFLFAESNKPVYEKIWSREEVRTVVFVHNNKLYADRFAEKFNRTVFFLKVPSKNAFNMALSIAREVSDLYKSVKADIVLISAGPCAKVVVWELARNGIWAIDTGHCWDDPLV